jgi:hypothetical protein
MEVVGCRRGRVETASSSSSRGKSEQLQTRGEQLHWEKIKRKQ